MKAAKNTRQSSDVLVLIRDWALSYIVPIKNIAATTLDKNRIVDASSRCQLLTIIQNCDMMCVTVRLELLANRANLLYETLREASAR